MKGKHFAVWVIFLCLTTFVSLAMAQFYIDPESETLSYNLEDETSTHSGSIDSSGNESVSFNSVVYDLDWFSAKADSETFEMLGFVAKNNDCYLIDLNTGKEINIHVQSAGNHLDVEPLTATDTSKMCELWGVSSASSISYLRRPMLIVTKDNRQIICSVYGTPHGTQDITSNNFPGQFCIHFKNSTTSGTQVVSSYAVTALNQARAKVAAAGKTLVTLSGNDSSEQTDTETGVEAYIRITSTNVVLCETADLSSQGIITLKTDAVMKVDEQKTINDVIWYHGTVRQDGIDYTGYVQAEMVTTISYADYIASISGDPAASEIEPKGMIKVTAENANVREGPGMDYEIMFHVYYGDNFYYVGVSGGWYHLLNGYYINSGYVQEISESDMGSSGVSFNSIVYDLDWFKAKDDGDTFNNLGFVAGNNDCYLIDLRTGTRFNIHVQSVGNHLEAEPLTATDTSKMCDLWGVSSASSISYLRRPMLIVTKDNRQIICSIYGTPHGEQDITSNNYPGQFCVHFLNSTTSGTKVVSSYAVTALNEARSMVAEAGRQLVTLSGSGSNPEDTPSPAETPDPSLNDETSIGMIGMTADSSNVRTEAGVNSQIAYTVGHSSAFYYNGIHNGWYRLFDGCYISSNDVDIIFEVDSKQTYQSGDSGDAVSWIQNALNTLGVYNQIHTGSFDSLTEEAVKEFQKKHGFTQTGIVDQETLSAIQSTLKGVNIDEEHFPDSVFRTYIMGNYDKNGNGSLSAGEINNAIVMVLSPDLGYISSLKGIEYLTELTYISCEGLGLTEVDLSHNAKITSVSLSNNNLLSLDFSSNTELEALDCRYNQLKVLDISNNSALRVLRCDGNEIESLDTANILGLESLDCSQNKITALNLSNASKLKRLCCDDNLLTELDISKCTELTEFYCWNNRLVSLDIRNAKVKGAFACEQNGRTVSFENGQFDLSTLGGGFSSDRVLAWHGAEEKNGILTVFQDTVSYEYDCGQGRKVRFFLCGEVDTITAPIFQIPSVILLGQELRAYAKVDQNAQEHFAKLYSVRTDGSRELIAEWDELYAGKLSIAIDNTLDLLTGSYQLETYSVSYIRGLASNVNLINFQVEGEMLAAPKLEIDKQIYLITDPLNITIRAEHITDAEVEIDNQSIYIYENTVAGNVFQGKHLFLQKGNGTIRARARINDRWTEWTPYQNFYVTGIENASDIQVQVNDVYAEGENIAGKITNAIPGLKYQVSMWGTSGSCGPIIAEEDGSFIIDGFEQVQGEYDFRIDIVNAADGSGVYQKKIRIVPRKETGIYLVTEQNEVFAEEIINVSVVAPNASKAKVCAYQRDAGLMLPYTSTIQEVNVAEGRAECILNVPEAERYSDSWKELYLVCSAEVNGVWTDWSEPVCVRVEERGELGPIRVDCSDVYYYNGEIEFTIYGDEGADWYSVSGDSGKIEVTKVYEQPGTYSLDIAELFNESNIYDMYTVRVVFRAHKKGYRLSEYIKNIYTIFPEQHMVSYRFEGENLPEEVRALIPQSEEKQSGTIIQPVLPSATEVSTPDGKWVFDGFYPEKAIMGDEDILFTGYWHLEKEPVDVILDIKQGETIEIEYWTTVGQSLRFLPTIGSEIVGMNMAWACEEDSIAEIDSAGIITARKKGKVVISGTTETGVQCNILLRVFYPVTSITFRPASLSIVKDQTKNLTTYVTAGDQNCINRLVTFSSENEEIAAVDKDTGAVTGINVGTTKIKAEADNGIIAECSVTVRDAHILSLPSSMQVIEKEAFANLENVDAIRIPGSVSFIDPDAFKGSDIELIVNSGSYAESWAAEKNIPYIIAD